MTRRPEHIASSPLLCYDPALDERQQISNVAAHSEDDSAKTIGDNVLVCLVKVISCNSVEMSTNIDL